MRFTPLLWTILVGGAGLLPLRADNLLKNGGFEQPVVGPRVTESKGGSPVLLEGDSSWAHYQSMSQDGQLVVGMTNDISRTGKQAIFVEFNKAAARKEGFLMTDLLPIKPAESYRISIWGRLDPQRPLTLDRSRPFMRVDVEFYQADEATQTGDTVYRVQMIPGSPDHLLFVSGHWSEYFTSARAPEDAQFMKVTFRWMTTGEEGDAEGLIYFDDAAVEPVVGTPAALPDAEAKPTPAPPPPAGDSAK